MVEGEMGVLWKSINMQSDIEGNAHWGPARHWAPFEFRLPPDLEGLGLERDLQGGHCI